MGSDGEGLGSPLTYPREVLGTPLTYPREVLLKGLVADSSPLNYPSTGSDPDDSAYSEPLYYNYEGNSNSRSNSNNSYDSSPPPMTHSDHPVVISDRDLIHQSDHQSVNRSSDHILYSDRSLGRSDQSLLCPSDANQRVTQILTHPVRHLDSGFYNVQSESKFEVSQTSLKVTVTDTCKL